MLLNNINSKTNTQNFENITNQELIDIYKNLKLHYAGNSLSNNYDEYFENYFKRISLELVSRGIEIIYKNNNFDVYLSNLSNINNNDNFKLDLINQQTIISDLTNKLPIIKSTSLTKDFKISKTKNFSDKISESKNSKYTFKVAGESMIDMGIHNGDVVYCSPFKYKTNNKVLTFEEIGRIIDKKLVIAKLFNVVFIKVAEYLPQTKIHTDSIILKSFNPNYYNFKINENSKFKIIGIVKSLIREF